MLPEDLVRLKHIVQAAGRIVDNVPASSEQFYKEHPFQLAAVIRHIEIIGEAAKNISKETRDEILEVPWTMFIRTRDRFTHAYFNLDFEIIWKVATVDVPRLLTDLLQRFPELQSVR